MLFFQYFFRVTQSRKTAELDKLLLSPSDYAIIIKGFPPNVSKEEISSILEDRFKFTCDPDVEIEYVNPVYDIHELIKVIREHDKWLS